MIFTDESVATEKRESFWRSMPVDIKELCDTMEADGLILFPTVRKVDDDFRTDAQ